MIVIDVATGQAAAGKNGERRSIHRRPYRRVKPIPKRSSMLDRHRAEIEAMTGVDVLTGLKAPHPDHFSDRNLRTTQRMVKGWRADQARRMICCWTTALTIVAEDGMPPPPRSVTSLGEATGP